jgi:hypothetical protein
MSGRCGAGGEGIGDKVQGLSQQKGLCRHCMSFWHHSIVMQKQGKSQL